MTDERKEYTVTAPDMETTDSIWDDLLTDGPTPDTIPDRVVEVVNERPENARNTSYLLTDEEAEALRQDPRVEAVEDLSLFKPVKRAFQDGNFNKNTTETGEKQNWGLLRHIKTTNVFGTSTTDPGGTYDYVLDGTDVDVVIVDSGIQADHPEFEDAEGNSRVQQINWYTASGVSGTMPPGFYVDYDGHGTHVAATVAGKTFGWAKNANIYAIKLDGLEGATDPIPGISVGDAFDCLLGWHNNKTNGNPTVMVNSWGYIVLWDVSNDSLTFNESTYYPITGGSYRGSAHTDATKDPAKGLTGQLANSSVYAFNFPVSSVNADVAQLINAGIVVVNAAGNGNLKHDTSGGADYDNYISATGLGNFYYHRGGAPHCGANYGFQVGAFGTNFIGGTEAKSVYSDSGPGVTIYAAGDRIMSAMSTTNIDASSFDYYLDSGYKQQLLSGTSMAAPQVAGMCALLLQAHPDWSPEQVQKWMIHHSRSALSTTGQDNDYSVTYSLHGGANRLAYFPMNGQRPYEIQGSA